MRTPLSPRAGSGQGKHSGGTQRSACLKTARLHLDHPPPQYGISRGKSLLRRGERKLRKRRGVHYLPMAHTVAPAETSKNMATTHAQERPKRESPGKDRVSEPLDIVLAERGSQPLGCVISISAIVVSSQKPKGQVGASLSRCRRLWRFPVL